MTTEILEPAPKADSKHWTPQNQRAFLEGLAQTGSVQQACDIVQLTPSTAYRLRIAARGGPMNLGWNAAILIARARLVDDLMGRAVDGQTDTIIHDGEKTTRYRHENRVAMSMLSRLDKMADEGLSNNADAIIARIIAQDFAAYLDLIESGASLSLAGQFIALRQPQISQNLDAQEQCDLLTEQDDKEAERAQTLAEITDPDARAAILSVWDDDGELRTDFPPPPDFEGDEEGQFGGLDYSRCLTEDEETAYWANEETRLAPLRAAATTSRDAYFGFDAAKQLEKRKTREKARKPANRPRSKTVPAIVENLRQTINQHDAARADAPQVYSAEGIPLAPWEVAARARMAQLDAEAASIETKDLASMPACSAPVWPDYIVDPGTGFRQFRLPVHDTPFAGEPVPPEFRGLGW